MAAGLPVVVSAVGGLPEIVGHAEHGLLIPPRDPEALASSLARLLADPDWARALGDRARDHVRTNFSLERLARDLNDSYDELTRKRLGY
jgi:D-inositol-3-phosphate glycosyltransferase